MSMLVWQQHAMPKRWLLVAASLVLALPVNLLGVRVYNEPVLVLGALIAVGCLCTRPTISRLSFGALVIGAVFSAIFLLGLLASPHTDFIVKDVVEALKPALYALFFVLGREAGQYVTEREVGRYITYCAVLLVLFSVLVYVPATHPFVDAYKGRESTEVWNLHFYRFSGTMGFPGMFSYWLVLALSLLLSDVSRRQLGILCVPVFVMFLIGLVLTGSRGGLVVFVLVMTLFCFSYVLRSRAARWMIVAGAVLIAGAGMLISTYGPELTSAVQVKYLVDGFSDIEGSSAGHRIREFNMMAEGLGQRPLLGFGPANEFIRTNFGPVENVYFYYGYKFGVCGLLFYGLISLYAICSLIKEWKRPGVTVPGLVALWSVVVLTVGAFSESVTEEYKSCFLFFLLLGVVSSMRIGAAAFLHESAFLPERRA